jgi:hypothetical protein
MLCGIMLSVIMLNVTNNAFMLNVVMLNVVMLRVVAPFVGLEEDDAAKNQKIGAKQVSFLTLCDLQ